MPTPSTSRQAQPASSCRSNIVSGRCPHPFLLPYPLLCSHPRQFLSFSLPCNYLLTRCLLPTHRPPPPDIMGLSAKAVDTAAKAADSVSPGKVLLEVGTAAKAAVTSTVSKATGKKRAGGKTSGAGPVGPAPTDHVKNSCN